MKNKRTIYLDHQATTPVGEWILRRMLPYWGDAFGNPHASDHIVGWDSSRAVVESARHIADLIGADPDEIIFTSGATESNNLALFGLVNGHRPDGRRNRLLVSAIEHKSVLAVAGVLESRFGVRVEFLPVDKEGCVASEYLASVLDDTVLAVSIMAVNNEIGTIQNIHELSRSVHSVGAVFHTDAAQAPSAMPIRGVSQDVDIMSLSGHKMGGPQGIGALYVRRDLQERIEPMIYGGGQQNGLRSGTLPLPLCVGMGAAAEWLMSERAQKERADLRARRDSFYERLSELPWDITVNGPASEKRHPGNLNVCFHGFAAQDILGAVQPSLAASTGSACTSGIPEPSHVLRAIGLSGNAAESSIRFSLGASTTDGDVDEAAQLIAAALEKLSGVRHHSMV